MSVLKIISWHLLNVNCADLVSIWRERTVVSCQAPVRQYCTRHKSRADIDDGSYKQGNITRNEFRSVID